MSRGYADLIAEYEARTPSSKKVFDRARRLMPGGETRSVTYYAPHPLSIAHAHGALLTDVDGRDYLDILNNYTSLVHGHTFAPVVAAVRDAAARGVIFPAPHSDQLDLAEHLISRHGCVERVRFTNSGTEAALLALRVAQKVTGRGRFLLFEGGYHGSAPMLIGDHPSIVRIRYNDAAALAENLDATVAAVLVEPFLGAGGVIPAQDGFLKKITELAHGAGALVVLDEVQSLRVAPGGAAQLEGLDADLVLLGKIIGGGYPIGALGGRAAHLDVLSHDHPYGISHSGTFNGHLVAVRAGLAALQHLTPAAITGLNTAAARLATRIEAAGPTVGMPVAVTRYGSLLNVHLQDERPVHARAVRAAASTGALHLALLLEGVYAAPRGLIALSTAVTGDELDLVGAAYERALARIADLRVAE